MSIGLRVLSWAFVILIFRLILPPIIRSFASRFLLDLWLPPFPNEYLRICTIDTFPMCLKCAKKWQFLGGLPTPRVKSSGVRQTLKG